MWCGVLVSVFSRFPGTWAQVTGNAIFVNRTSMGFVPVDGVLTVFGGVEEVSASPNVATHFLNDVWSATPDCTCASFPCLVPQSCFRFLFCFVLLLLLLLLLLAPSVGSCGALHVCATLTRPLLCSAMPNAGPDLCSPRRLSQQGVHLRLRVGAA